MSPRRPLPPEVFLYRNGPAPAEERDRMDGMDKMDETAHTPACGHPSQEGNNYGDPLFFSDRAYHRRREIEAAMQAAERRLGELPPDELVIAYEPVRGIATATIAGEIIYQTPLAMRMPLEPPANAEEAANLVKHLVSRITDQALEIEQLRERMARSRELLRQAISLE